ncbi:MAG: PDZ domain-containing protein [Alphaproteobacteria bacterium]|nr:PDZ domain-containing protein [Alphaproteobacteria bacterium]MBU0795328.1 PDZ domain-containing protein [Alphaproteobacteria bacterium]MBU0877364.1 PDZ domain-containing protein [Alphaproteobacteria bacterium]MBU1770641.1 PDZ domain-containing protein [Alphaproteobacteria bacterium]
MRRCLLPALLLLTLPASAVLAQDQPPAPLRSAPVAQPILSTVPEARDIAWTSGALKLEVDATDTDRRILGIRQTIPMSTGGPLTLLFPEWLPGHHAPRGQIEKIAGLSFTTADGQPLRWRRDPLNVYAFHLSVPEGAGAVIASFQFLAPTAGNQGRIVMTDSLLNLQWNSVSLYPAGFYTRRIPIQASVTLPEGWTAATALNKEREGNTVRYEETDYETLVDSPIFAGLHAREVELAPDVRLSIFADTEEELKATEPQIELHRRMVDEAVALFGARHYDRYNFLLSISDKLGGIGLEHHRLSENGVPIGYFTQWERALGDRDLLAHEFVHSWNGKYRRPEMLWTPDFATPMQDDLLWVYEGQTQFWGYVLSARSGMLSKAETLDALAAIAARLDNTRGRTWRPLIDTTYDPIIAARRPKAWSSWQRSEDYYNEGLMIWLEVDAIIQRETDGARSIDDFAKAFFGMNDRDWGVLTYNRQDVIETLNGIVAYDWDALLRERLEQTNTEVTKAGFDLGGYKLIYGSVPNSTIRTGETVGKYVDQSFGTGLIVGEDGVVRTVVWDSPAFKAAMAVGDTITAVGDTEFSADAFRDGVRATAQQRPLTVTVRRDKRYRTITLDYSGGLRYPRLEKSQEGPTSLDRLLSARTGEAPVN